MNVKPKLKKQTLIKYHANALLTISSKRQFYKIIAYMNTEFGRGKEYWTMSNRVLKYLNNDLNVPVIIRVAQEDISEGELSLFLSLL